MLRDFVLLGENRTGAKGGQRSCIVTEERYSPRLTGHAFYDRWKIRLTVLRVLSSVTFEDTLNTAEPKTSGIHVLTLTALRVVVIFCESLLLGGVQACVRCIFRG